MTILRFPRERTRMGAREAVAAFNRAYDSLDDFLAHEAARQAFLAWLTGRAS